MPDVSACFLPVFYLVGDRLIASTGWFKRTPVAGWPASAAAIAG